MPTHASCPRKIKVIQPPEEVPAEIIASSIVKIADAMQELNSSRLTRKAIVVLIHHQSKLPMRDIEIVMNNLKELRKDWIKP